MNTLMMEQQNESWRDSYRAALFEPNKRKLPMRIAMAEKQITIETRKLFNAGHDITERSAMNVALFALQALRSSLDCPEAESERDPTAQLPNFFEGAQELPQLITIG